MARQPEPSQQQCQAVILQLRAQREIEQQRQLRLIIEGLSRESPK